jgi:hypothetical protein
MSWGWDDLQWPYGAPVSALSFNDNTVELVLTADPANPTATVAEWSPNIEYYTLDNTMTPAAKGETAHPGLDRRPGSLLVRAFGTAPVEGAHEGGDDDPAPHRDAFKEVCAEGHYVAGVRRQPTDCSIVTNLLPAMPVKPPLPEPLSIRSGPRWPPVVATRVPCGRPGHHQINKGSQAAQPPTAAGEDPRTGGALPKARVVRQFTDQHRR